MPVSPIHPAATAALPPSDPDFPASAPQPGGAPHSVTLDLQMAEDAVAATEEKVIAHAAETGEFLDPPVYVCDGTKTYNQILADLNKGRSPDYAITLSDLMVWNGYFLSTAQLTTLGTQIPQAGFRLSLVDPLMQPAQWPRDGILEYTADIYSADRIERTTEVQQTEGETVKTAKKDLAAYYTHLLCFSETGSDYAKLKSKAETAVRNLDQLNPKAADGWKQQAFAVAEKRYGAYIAKVMDNGTISPAPNDDLQAAANRMHDQSLSPEERRVAVAEYAYIMAHGSKPTGSGWTTASNTLNFITAMGPGAVATGGAIKAQAPNANPALQWTQSSFQRPQIVMTCTNGTQIRLFDNGNGSTTMVAGREHILPLTKRPTFIGQHMAVIPGGIGQYMTGTPTTATPSPGSNPAGGRTPALPVQVVLSSGQVVEVKQLTPGNFNVMPKWTVSPLNGQGTAVTVQAWSAKEAADKTQTPQTAQTDPGASAPAQRATPPVTASQRHIMLELINDAHATGNLPLARQLEAQLAAGDLSALRGVMAMAEVQPGVGGSTPPSPWQPTSNFLPKIDNTDPQRVEKAFANLDAFLNQLQNAAANQPELISQNDSNIRAGLPRDDFEQTPFLIFEHHMGNALNIMDGVSHPDYGAGTIDGRFDNAVQYVCALDRTIGWLQTLMDKLNAFLQTSSAAPYVQIVQAQFERYESRLARIQRLRKNLVSEWATEGRDLNAAAAAAASAPPR